MSGPSLDEIRSALSHVASPGGGPDIVSAGHVQGLTEKDGRVTFALEIDPRFAELFEPVRTEAEALIRRMPGVTHVSAVLTAHSNEPSAPPARPAPAQRRGRAGHGTPPPPSPEAIPGIKHIVAVASGKGGVGKSTVATNLAIALAGQGLKTGLLDADIYGPSIPRMLGIHEKPESDGKVVQPIQKFGLKIMSIGFLVEEETPMIWRGPMVMSALTQMLKDVNWGELDVLVVDMPPGTGDAQLTLVQRVPVRGAIIVSTPQEVALIDARKGLGMFEKVNVPILGMVENMAWLEMPDGSKNFLFGEGGVKTTAAKRNVDFLGEVPLYTDIRVAGDEGTPIVAAAPNSPGAKVFDEIAKKVAAAL